MRTKRILILLPLLVATLLLTGCEEYATYTPSAADLTTIAERLPEGPTKDAVQATAVARYLAAAQAEQAITAAQATEIAARDELQRQTAAMTAEAQATIAAQDNIARATTQALSARATSQALDTQATAQAVAFQATRTAEAHHATATVQAAIAQATSTAEAKALQATTEARNATATAESRQATATMQAAADAVEKTAQAAQAVMLDATAQAVQRKAEMEEAVQGVKTAAPWVGLLLITAVLIMLGVYFAPVVKDRARVIRRKAGEGEPIVMMERDREGRERIALPLRSFYAMLTAGENPSDQFQDRATARTQLANVVSAARGSGQKRALHRRPQSRTQNASSTSVIRVVEPNEVRPWIDDARTQLIEQGVVTDGNI